MQEDRKSKLMNYLNCALDDVAQMERKNARQNNGLLIGTKVNDQSLDGLNESEIRNRLDAKKNKLSKSRYRIKEPYTKKKWSNNRYTDNRRQREYGKRRFYDNRRSGGGGGGGEGGEGREGGVYYDWSREKYIRNKNSYFRRKRGVGVGITNVGVTSTSKTYFNRKREGKYYIDQRYNRKYNNKAYTPINKRKYLNTNTSVVPVSGLSNNINKNIIYKRPLINNNTRRIYKETLNSRNTVISSGVNCYKIVPSKTLKPYRNINISLYRNRRLPINSYLKRKTLNRPKKISGITHKLKEKRNINNEKGENKIDKFLMSKIKIYALPEAIPPPLIQQLHAEVNIPRSLKRQVNKKKEEGL